MKEKWYKSGLRFKCTECGGCCTGEPGVVWISDEEIEALAGYLEISVEQTKSHYLRRVDGRWALRERPANNWDCVFLDGKRCTVYPVRPKQCRTFPWWPQNLESEKSWRETARQCEGINDDAPLISIGEIEANLES